MCGIFAYSGKTRNATEVVIDGLKSLDYRGYDSWGVSAVIDNEIKTQKCIGIVDKNKLLLENSKVAIGHTRWATNGGVTQVNAHPHSSSDNSFVLAQNGIVENCNELKEELCDKGYKFVSQTDTEVIVRLIEKYLITDSDFETALSKAFKKCAGRNTVIVLRKNGEIYAVKNGSPLVVGIPQGNNELYISSDTLSLAPYLNQTVTLDNNEMIIYKNNRLKIKNVMNRKIIKYKINKNNIEHLTNSKGSYKHYMIKEIFEQPLVIDKIISKPKKEFAKIAELVKKAKNVYCIGSGTAGAAAFQTAYYLRKYAKINAIGLIGAEAKEYLDLFKKNDLIIALSQSGETADVLDILETAKKIGLKIISYVNMPGSFMSKISDISIMAEAGPEICVMSTKVFVSQISWGYLLAKACQGKYNDGNKNLKLLSIELSNLLNNPQIGKKVSEICNLIVKKESVFLLGKGQNMQIIKEGMVKIIEGSYIHAHAIPAGDLKHYAITLMEKGVCVIAVLSDDENKSDVINAIHEIKARGATILGIATETIDSFNESIVLPKINEINDILNVVPIQLMAYKLATLKGNNVDKPRNIAKSVTVK
jgi:glucosamine--fructose-6-phosphate aminotransferase (isomerizing)